MNKAKLFQLLDEMSLPDSIIKSIDAPNWRFWQKAERLDDNQVFSLLREFLEARTQKGDIRIRENTYLVFGKLLLRTTNHEYCQFFVDCLDRESNKYVLYSILTSIRRLQFPSKVRIDAIVACSKSDQWLVRQSAIHALIASNTAASREAVRCWVKQKDTKTYKFELSYANAVLGCIGNVEDIELLEQHIHSRIPDVKDSAIYAINNIRKRLGANA